LSWSSTYMLVTLIFMAFSFTYYVVYYVRGLERVVFLLVFPFIGVDLSMRS
jgi:hypothetical protein